MPGHLDGLAGGPLGSREFVVNTLRFREGLFGWVGALIEHGFRCA